MTDSGIDGYWVKESPGEDVTFGHAVKNVAEFFRKVADVLEWSRKTRNWVEDLYNIADVVSQSNSEVGERLWTKVRSFHALMNRSFTPFSREISEGLQQNLAFMITFSCMNDLTSWICIKKELDARKTVWYTMEKGVCQALVSREYVRKKGNDVAEYSMQDGSEIGYLRNFPDTNVALEILMRKDLVKASGSFREIAKVRNGLPLTHGKVGSLTSISKSVEHVDDEHITTTIGILKVLVEKHSASI